MPEAVFLCEFLRVKRQPLSFHSVPKTLGVTLVAHLIIHDHVLSIIHAVTFELLYWFHLPLSFRESNLNTLSLHQFVQDRVLDYRLDLQSITEGGSKPRRMA